MSTSEICPKCGATAKYLVDEPLKKPGMYKPGHHPIAHGLFWAGIGVKLAASQVCRCQTCKHTWVKKRKL